MIGLTLYVFMLTYKISRIPILGRFWYHLYSAAKRIIKNKPAKIKIHGFNVVQPFDFTYPLYSRIFRTLNNPLIECVYQINELSITNGERVGVIVFDVGAAIGDTVLLLQSNCKAMVKQYYCIEGDKEFYSYLKKNMSCFNNVTAINTLLSDTNSPINSLVRTHSGTASSQGSECSNAISFDGLIESLTINKIDLIKIDTDGYDGKILKGAKKSISLYKPLIIFEWHPLLCIQVKTDYHEHFSILKDLGYDTFIWFTKFGSFSHFVNEPSEDYIEKWAEICVKSEFDSDWHYDIVALHKESGFSILEFANSTFSRNKISPY